MHLEFAEPWLLFLLPIPVLLFLVRLWNRRAALRYPAIPLFDSIPHARLPVIAAEGLRFLAVTAVVLALAGPRTPDLKTQATSGGHCDRLCPRYFREHARA